MVNGKGPVSGSYTSTIKYICNMLIKLISGNIYTLGLKKNKKPLSI